MRLAAIVLAAGASRRFGADKLAAPFRGKPLLHHAIAAARAAPVEKVVLVHRPGPVIGNYWPGEPPVCPVAIDSDALSASLKAGIAQVQDMDGAFIFLGDMPLIPHGLAGELAQALGSHYAVQPRHEGKPGHPVLLSSQAFADIARLEGDEGAGKLLARHPDVVLNACSDAGIHRDADTPEALARLEKHKGGSTA